MSSFPKQFQEVFNESIYSLLKLLMVIWLLIAKFFRLSSTWKRKYSSEDYSQNDVVAIVDGKNLLPHLWKFPWISRLRFARNCASNQNGPIQWTKVIKILNKTVHILYMNLFDCSFQERFQIRRRCLSIKIAFCFKSIWFKQKNIT